MTCAITHTGSDLKVFNKDGVNIFQVVQVVMHLSV